MNEEHYGRRKEDLVDLPQEVAARLTDSQKINIKIIQNLTSINTALNDLQHDVGIHNKLLVTGNGEPTIQERLRSIEGFINAVKYWSRFIGGAIIVQTIAFFVGIVIAVVRFLPILEKLASQP